VITGSLITAALLTWGPAPLPKPEVDEIAAKAPALCREPELPLDEEGRRLLLSLESQLANEVLGNAKLAHDGNQLNTREVLSLLRQYPQTEMVFVFPAPIVVPNSRYRARLSETRVPHSRVASSAFQVEISRVVMLRSRRQTALAFGFSSGAVGAPPNGGIWLWGIGGRFCAIPRAHGRWRIYPLSAVVIS
jgi:hypothetical protein